VSGTGDRGPTAPDGMPASPLRVVIADDQGIVRGGLRMILEAAGIKVAGEAADGLAAIELARRLKPDVLLMDIRMPALDGIEATRRLAREQPAVKVLVLTTYSADAYVYEALRAGAAGFLLKMDSPPRLVDAVRVVAAGEALLAPEITRRLIDRYVTGAPPDHPAPPALARLTAREREVLTLIARGLSNTEIAGKLYLGEGTVKTHVVRILAKLGLRDRVQVVVYAYEHQLVRPGHSG
jgi:DNA-binding NarL/FixJ family response regulator